MVRVRFFSILMCSMLVFVSFASTAFAQANSEDNDNGRDVTFVDCSQVQNVVAIQYGVSQGQYVADGEEIAGIAQELNITQNQVNSCLDGDTDDDKPAKNEDDDKNDENLPEGKDDVIDGTVAADELPATGGLSLISLGLGLALVVGGVSLVRAGR